MNWQLQLSERRLLLMVGDAVCNITAVAVALRIWAWVGEIGFDADFLLLNSWWFFLLTSLWLIIASANDFYDLRVVAKPFESLSRLVQIELQLSIVYLLIFFLSPRDALPRLFILYYAAVSLILIIVWRLARVVLIGWTNRARRAVVVGSGWAARAIIEVLNTHAADDYTVVGVIASDNTHSEIHQTVTILREGGSFLPVLQSLDASEVILAYGNDLPGHIFQGVMDAYENGYAIIPMPILYEQVTGRVPIEHVGTNDWNVVLPIEQTTLFNPYPILKRIMDISLALIGSLVFLLMLPFIALAIQLDSPGSIFYRQERVGKGGRSFNILKLRTMIPDAEKVSGAQWSKGDHDPRITRVGRWLRKSRLDEVPQLINVLRGEMSLIGPRPERPIFVEKLSESIPFYRTRHIIKPGVTGWAQVKYGYGASVNDALRKLQYDLYYVRHQSILLDISIILRTVRKVLSLAGQ